MSGSQFEVLKFEVLNQEREHLDLIDVEVSKINLVEKIRVVFGPTKRFIFVGSAHASGEPSGIKKKLATKPKKKVYVVLPIVRAKPNQKSSKRTSVPETVNNIEPVLPEI